MVSAWGFLPGERSFGFRLGVLDPTPSGGLDLMSRRGVGGGFEYSRHLAEWFALGGEIDALYFQKENDTLVAGGSHVGGLATAALVTGRINLVFDRPWTVYVLGGGGVHTTSAKVETLAGSRTHKDQGFAVLAAGGAEAFVMRDVSTSFQARFHGLRLDPGKFGLESAEFLSYQVGLHYWFGVR